MVASPRGNYQLEDHAERTLTSDGEKYLRLEKLGFVLSYKRKWWLLGFSEILFQ